MRLFCLLILIQFLNEIEAFSFKLEPFNAIDLAENQTKILFKYPFVTENYEKFRVISKDGNFLLIGARNRLLTVNLNNNRDIQITATNWPTTNSYLNKNCTNKFCANYILAGLPLNHNENNMLLCGTFFGTSKCIQTKYDTTNGYLKSFDTNTVKNAPKFITLPPNSENTLYLTSNSSNSNRILYTASSWTDNTQYLAAYSSANNYQIAKSFKMIGKSKSFVKFAETSDKMFLFQNEDSFDVDDGETTRDILITTSLVSQICKNDNGASNSIDKDIFYSELTAKIYCFKEMFRSDSGNSENFKFDSLKFITNFINLNAKNQTRKLFYGVFNTPENQITASAICFFDIKDIMNVFQKQNFKYLDEKNRKNQYAKDSLLDPQDCPNLSDIEKTEYRSFTSKLSYMTRAAFPINRRKASFLITNDYRIICLLIADDSVNENSQPKVKKLSKFDNLNIIYAGTDNGKLLRIAHYFTNNYFENDNPLEERVELLEEIQLFDKNTEITQIEIIKNQKIIAISLNQIRSISLNFCEMYSDSCEQCVKQNANALYETRCFWSNNECVPESALNTNFDYFNSLNQCDQFKIISIDSVKILSHELETSVISSTTQTTELTTMNATTVNFHINSEYKTSQQKPSIVSDFEMGLKRDYLKFKSKANDTDLNRDVLIILAIVGLVTSLLSGIILGCLLKTVYSKKLINRLVQLFNFKKEKKIQKNTNNEISKIRLARSSNDLYEKSSVTTSNSTSNDDDSFGSSSKSNSTFLYSNASSRAQLHNEKRINKNYFTVNNDYGIFPKTVNTTASLDYTRLAASNSTNDATNSTNDTRLSSSSSSADSSSYALINLINSQTCLINSSKEATINNQLKSINENSETNRYSKSVPEEEYSNCTNKLNINKNYSFSSSSTPSTYSPSATATAIIESTYSSMCSRNTDTYKRHHHLKKKSLNVYQTKSPSYNQEIISITSAASPEQRDQTTVYLKSPDLNDGLFLNNSYV